MKLWSSRRYRHRRRRYRRYRRSRSKVEKKKEGCKRQNVSHSTIKDEQDAEKKESYRAFVVL
jgi:hypothetical protein